MFVTRLTSRRLADALQKVFPQLLIVLVDIQRSRATQFVTRVLSHVELFERRELGGLGLASGDVLVRVRLPPPSRHGQLWRGSRVRDAAVLKIFKVRVNGPVTCAWSVRTQLLSPHLVGLLPSLRAQRAICDSPSFFGVKVAVEHLLPVPYIVRARHRILPTLRGRW